MTARSWFSWCCSLRFLTLLIMVGAIAGNKTPAFAQIIPDDTLGDERSVVIPLDPDFPIDAIDGGAIRSINLFHSFREFNVDQGRGAYFTNPIGIENILSRVTGSNPSNILGTLGVLGNANLFLINPNGIIFGSKASLDVGGSFVATTANAIQLGDAGLFSASAPATSNLLTINPSALFFNAVNRQAEIVNRSAATRADAVLKTPTGEGFFFNGDPLRSITGLQVLDQQSLLLVGGDVSLDGGGRLNALGGRVELGGVAGSGSVGLDVRGNDLSLSFPDNIARADVSLTDRARVDVAAGGGGSIAVNAQTVDILEGSLLLTGIAPGLGLDDDSKAGNIDINATGTITVGGSRVFNAVGNTAVGDAGDIKITAESLTVTNGAAINTSSLGQGNAGSIIINTNESVAFDASSADSVMAKGAKGNSGGIEITTGSLSVIDGAQLSASTLGQGNAGKVRISADTVSFDASGAASGVAGGAEGNGGGIEITTGSLSVTDGAQLSASTLGRGNAADVIINADQISLDRGEIYSHVGETGIGNSGNIKVTANSINMANGAGLITVTKGQGNAGNIEIVTGSFSATSGAQLTASTFNQGNAGNITINARGNVSFDGRRIDESERILESAAFTNIEDEGVGQGGSIIVTAESISFSNGAGLFADVRGKGNAGDIQISTDTLLVTSGSQLRANVLGQGNAGNIVIDADDSVSFDGGDAFSDVTVDGIGQGGNIQIITDSLSVTNGGQLQTNTEGQGDAGNITINASKSVAFDGVNSERASSAAFSSVEEKAVGDGGRIEITTGSLSVTDGAQLLADTLGQGDAGSIIINASESVAFEGSSKGLPSSARSGVEAITAVGDGGDLEITTGFLSVANGAKLNARTSGQGKGGEIQISSNFLSLTNGAQIDSRSFGPENSGDITIKVLGSLQSDNSQISTSSTQAAGGAINITAGDIRLRGDNDIRTNVASGAGSGGNLTLKADSIIAFDDSDILAFARDGQGGDITLDSPAFFGENFQPAPANTNPDTLDLDKNGRVDVNASGAVAGALTIPNVSFIQNSLTELPDNPVATETLIANSCVARDRQPGGTFIITGAGGLPVRPGDASVSPYSTGTVRTVPSDESSKPGAGRTWQKGDPIVEPQGVYRLASGKLVMSRKCSKW